MIDDQRAEHHQTEGEEPAAHSDDDGQRRIEKGDEGDVDAVDEGDLLKNAFIVGEPPEHAEEDAPIEHDQQKEDDGADKKVVALDAGPADLQPGHHEGRTGQHGQSDAAAQEIDEVGPLSLHQGQGILRMTDIFQATHHIAAKAIEHITIEADEDDHDDGGLPRIGGRRDGHQASVRCQLFGEG